MLNRSFEAHLDASKISADAQTVGQSHGLAINWYHSPVEKPFLGVAGGVLHYRQAAQRLEGEACDQDRSQI